MCDLVNGSPVPAHTMLWSLGATAREPIDDTGSLSKMGDHRVPPSTDFQIPPEAAPA